MATKSYLLADSTCTNQTLTGWQTYAPTVTLVGGTGNTVPVYSSNLGRYLRMGNLVYVDINLSGDGGDEGAGTGQLNIALPVQAGASINGDVVTLQDLTWYFDAR